MPTSGQRQQVIILRRHAASHISLPSFLSLWGSDLDGIISTHLPWRPQVADMPHPFLSSCLFLSDFPKHWRVASLFIGLPHHHVPATIVLAVHSLYLPFLASPARLFIFSHISKSSFTFFHSLKYSFSTSVPYSYISFFLDSSLRFCFLMFVFFILAD